MDEEEYDDINELPEPPSQQPSLLRVPQDGFNLNDNRVSRSSYQSNFGNRFDLIPSNNSSNYKSGHSMSFCSRQSNQYRGMYQQESVNLNQLTQEISSMSIQNVTDRKSQKLDQNHNFSNQELSIEPNNDQQQQQEQDDDQSHYRQYNYQEEDISIQEKFKQELEQDKKILEIQQQQEQQQYQQQQQQENQQQQYIQESNNFTDNYEVNDQQQNYINNQQFDQGVQQQYDIQQNQQLNQQNFQENQEVVQESSILNQKQQQQFQKQDIDKNTQKNELDQISLLKQQLYAQSQSQPQQQIIENNNTQEQNQINIFEKQALELQKQKKQEYLNQQNIFEQFEQQDQDEDLVKCRQNISNQVNQTELHKMVKLHNYNDDEEEQQQIQNPNQQNKISNKAIKNVYGLDSLSQLNREPNKQNLKKQSFGKRKQENSGQDLSYLQDSQMIDLESQNLTLTNQHSIMSDTQTTNTYSQISSLNDGNKSEKNIYCRCGGQSKSQKGQKQDNGDHCRTKKCKCYIYARKCTERCNCDPEKCIRKHLTEEQIQEQQIQRQEKLRLEGIKCTCQSKDRDCSLVSCFCRQNNKKCTKLCKCNPEQCKINDEERQQYVYEKQQKEQKQREEKRKQEELLKQIEERRQEALRQRKLKMEQEQQ